MANQYVGEIRMFAGNFAIEGWLFCDGSLLPISEYEVLFNLIGTTYGGDGIETFAVPDLRGRVPIHTGNNGVSTYVIGEAAGVEQVTLTLNQLPVHNHAPMASSAASGSNSPTGNYWASNPVTKQYSTAAPAATMSAMTGSAGGSQPHDNMLPYLCVSFIIAWSGVFPSQS